MDGVNSVIDKKFCVSSYLAFRYIEKDKVDFFEGLKHENLPVVQEKEQILVGIVMI